MVQFKRDMDLVIPTTAVQILPLTCPRPKSAGMSDLNEGHRAIFEIRLKNGKGREFALSLKPLFAARPPLDGSFPITSSALISSTWLMGLRP